MPIQQRIGWIAAAVLALTLPIWLDAVLAPGDSLTIWTWSDARATVERGIAILFVVSAFVGYLFFRKAAKDWKEWKAIRFGLGMWSALVILFSGSTFYLFGISVQSEAASYERDNFVVRTIQSEAVDGTSHFVTVMSCERKITSQTVIYLDEFTGGNGAGFRESDEEESILFIDYTNEGRVLNTTSFDLDSLYNQCVSGSSPRPNPNAVGSGA
ncbi:MULTISPECIES: hypothetical protein [Gammaproteobacteria]|uniref:hypothetical protein n=1 Tax=Gammaproteobacteria TaxID=1236 RepID=UPI000DCF7616|nr:MULTISPECIES: hypothetical protein [Gammaproteobacteria]RTE86528.1 hypothetical protein DQX04_08200 [Aliidiomarina sp. B3213]TCZ90917.1 hypothetical protein EYQ95_08845 [Lysobacter sp. N42]